MWPSLWLSVVLGRVKMRFREEFIAFIRFKTVLVKGRHLFWVFWQSQGAAHLRFFNSKNSNIKQIF
jgi:hypothetical protein